MREIAGARREPFGCEDGRIVNRKWQIVNSEQWAVGSEQQIANSRTGGAGESVKSRTQPGCPAGDPGPLPVLYLSPASRASMWAVDAPYRTEGGAAATFAAYGNTLTKPYMPA
jgi:hypothetical protein